MSESVKEVSDSARKVLDNVEVSDKAGKVSDNEYKMIDGANLVSDLYTMCQTVQKVLDITGKV